MKYKLMTLSPIHIGNGEQISNWSYVGENGKVSVYSFEKIIKELKSDAKKLINLTSQIERNPLSKSLKEIISSFGIKTEPEYTVPLRGKLIKQRWDRNRHQNITEYKHIWEFIKENGKVYIPGSEIKGAIRTA
ncbi:type III-A CRISPR-associated RAMP protein Csm5, partial [Persephonella sp.]